MNGDGFSDVIVGAYFFLNGSLTRLVDADAILRSKIVEFVGRGDFGLASGPKSDGGYDRVWYNEPVAPEEVAFAADVFLLRKVAAEALKAGAPRPPTPEPGPQPELGPVPPPEPRPEPGPEPVTGVQAKTVRLVPPLETTHPAGKPPTLERRGAVRTPSASLRCSATPSPGRARRTRASTDSRPPA